MMADIVMPPAKPMVVITTDIIAASQGSKGVAHHIAVPNSVAQPAAAVTSIRVVAGAIPAVLLCAGILFAWLYPLGRENYAEIAAGLAERRGRVTADG